MPENITSDFGKLPDQCDRRRLLATAMGTAVTFTAAPVVADQGQLLEAFPKDPAEALVRLRAGNLRFVEGKTRHSHQSADWRKYLVSGQRPFATVLGCSDSRVPTELVFDQGFGDLFVVRVAGNVIAADVVASLSYAARHLRTPLFVVMGHTGCGAVAAALDARLKKVKEPERIEILVKLIEPGLKDLDLKSQYSALLATAVELNVRWSVAQLMGLEGPKEAIRDGQIMLVGAIYDLETGRIRFLA